MAQQCQSLEYFLQVFIPVAFQDRPSKAQRGTQECHWSRNQPHTTREKVPSCHPHSPLKGWGSNPDACSVLGAQRGHRARQPVTSAGVTNGTEELTLIL